MNTGLHDANGLSPEVSYQIYKIYVIPRLLYGLEIIPLNKTAQLDKINRYHIKTLSNIQSLPQRTATSAVYQLLGALPIEAELHKRQLSLLYNVIKSENKCLRDLVERQLACSFNNTRSFSMWSIKPYLSMKSNRKAMNRNWSNQKANPALKTKTGNK